MSGPRKPPAERRAEIVAAARRLFTTKGAAGTSVSEIVGAAGVAQGTFYWYFSSKDEALNAVVKELTDELCDAIEAVVGSPNLSAPQKLEGIRRTLLPCSAGEDRILKYFHARGDKHFHDELVGWAEQRLKPAVAKVIKQGVKEGDFDVPYPKEAAAIVLSASMALHDDAFRRHTKSGGRQVQALMEFVLRGLGYHKPKGGS